MVRYWILGVVIVDAVSVANRWQAWHDTVNPGGHLPWQYWLWWCVWTLALAGLLIIKPTGRIVVRLERTP